MIFRAEEWELYKVTEAIMNIQPDKGWFGPAVITHEQYKRYPEGWSCSSMPVYWWHRDMCPISKTEALLMLL